MQQKIAPILAKDKEPSFREISVGEVLHTIWYWRWLFIFVVVSVIIAGFAYVKQLIPKYTATSSLLLQMPTSKVLDISSVLGRSGVQPFSSNVVLNSEKEVLKSKKLAEKVVIKLNLTEVAEFNPRLRVVQKGLRDYLHPNYWVPEEWKKALGLASKPAANEAEAKPVVTETPAEIAARELSVAANLLRPRIFVKVTDNSNIVNISVTSLNPKLAADIANELANAYIIDQLEVKFDKTKKTTQWLDDQLYDLKQKVSASERAVEDYRNSHGLTKGASTEILSAQLSAINTQLVATKTKREELEVQYNQAKRLLAQSNSTNLDIKSELFNAAGLQDLWKNEASLNQKIAELSVEYGKKHPKIVQVNAELRDVQQKIKDEVQKIIRGLADEVEIIKARERSLASSLKQMEGETGTQNKETIQLRALEREAEANKTLFNTFLTRFKETTSVQDMQEADARVISSAEIPNVPSYPNKQEMYTSVFAISIVAGLGVVFLVVFLNTGVQTPEQIEQLFKLSTIGVVPKLFEKTPHTKLLGTPQSSFAEALNSIQISLMLLSPDKQKKIIQVTSSIPDEGKSTLSLSLAQMLGRSGKKVLLVNADLRRPSLSGLLTVEKQHQGLIELVLSGDDDSLLDYIVTVADYSIDYLPPGQGASKLVNPTEVFASSRMKVVVDILRQHYEYIIFDTPPVMAAADSRLLGSLVDETLFVIRWNETPRKVIDAAINELKKSNIHISGCVLQQVNMKQYDSYGYGGSGYYYYYGRYKHYYSH